MQISSHTTDSEGTFFASAERTPSEELVNFADTCLNNPIVKVILRSVEGIVLILNHHRQILASNQDVLQMLGLATPNCLIGLRPGEIFNCVHAMEGPGGCGTSMHCKACGAADVILTSQDTGLPATNECMLTINRGGTVEAAEFVVRASPLQLDDHALTILVMQDISAVKRRDALEKVFFHDIINILSGLKGWSELLLGKLPDSTSAAKHIVRLSNRLTEEVLGQRMLLQAEKGELSPDFMPVPVAEVLADLSTFFVGHDAAEGRSLETTPVSSHISVTTNKNLLIRVLINMVKNALEATEQGGSVRVWFAMQDGRPAFFVHNAGVIPDSIQLQIFQRSFSTKSLRGRGLGTYSMKLFGERYLGGTVDFESSDSEGTIFFIELPAVASLHGSFPLAVPVLPSGQTTTPVTPTELCNLPGKLVCSLYRAAKTADIDALQILIDKAAPHLPHGVHLLRGYLHRFDYQAISALLQPYAESAKEEVNRLLLVKESILVVDGDPDMLILLMGLLKKDNYRVRPVTSGAMALEAATQFPPDLILLDIHMPDMDGYELCRSFKVNDALRHVPVIFLSAVEEAFDKVRAFRSGAVDYIAKPFQVDELRARIATHLKLRKYARELKSANSELEAFSYSVSHDLKAPLRHIQMFNAAIMESYLDQMDDEGREFLQRIQRTSVRMSDLIDDLLLFSRIGNAEINRTTIDLSSVVREVAESLREAEPDRDVVFTIADGITADADPRLIRVVAENLLNNAWKYTRKTAGARIDFGVLDEDGETTYFVRDNGVGFDMAYIGKLFQVFERLHSPSEFEGSGVGLSTVRRIIDRHGGRVWAHGEVGKGAEFRFCL